MKTAGLTLKKSPKCDWDKCKNPGNNLFLLGGAMPTPHSLCDKHYKIAEKRRGSNEKGKE